jgi:hypothetical protein
LLETPARVKVVVASFFQPISELTGRCHKERRFATAGVARARDGQLGCPQDKPVDSRLRRCPS